MVISIAGLFKLRSEAFIVDDLPKSNTVYTDLKFFEKHFKGLSQLIRKQNIEATEVMKNRGVKAVKWPQADINQLRASSERVMKNLIGKLYPQSLLDEAFRLRDSIPNNLTSEK